MSIIYILLSILYIAGCITLVTLILLQKKRAGGLGSIAGIGNAAQTYWDKNKGRSIDGKLEFYSKVLGAVLAVMTVMLCVIK